jgi:hypothetical protein
MHRISASMASSKPVTSGGPTLSALGYRTTTGRSICNTSWHLALFELARGDAERAEPSTTSAIGRAIRRCFPSTRRRSCGAGTLRRPPAISSGRGRRTRAPAFPQASLTPSPICMRPLPKQRSAMTSSCRRRIGGLHQLARDTSRRAMLRPHCAPAPLPSPVVQTPRPARLLGGARRPAPEGGSHAQRGGLRI